MSAIRQEFHNQPWRYDLWQAFILLDEEEGDYRCGIPASLDFPPHGSGRRGHRPRPGRRPWRHAPTARQSARIAWACRPRPGAAGRSGYPADAPRQQRAPGFHRHLPQPLSPPLARPGDCPVSRTRSGAARAPGRHRFGLAVVGGGHADGGAQEKSHRRAVAGAASAPDGDNPRRRLFSPRQPVAGLPHTGEGYKRLVRSCLGLDVELEQFAGTWVEIPPRRRCRLGGAAERRCLGQSALIGSRAFHDAAGVRIRPAHADQIDAFHDPQVRDMLSALFRGYAGTDLRMELIAPHAKTRENGRTECYEARLPLSVLH